MAKKLLILIGMLAVMIVAAVPAFAQQQGPITATGVLGPPDTSGPDPEPTYPLTDEASGTTYELISGFVELEPYVGNRVTIEGVRIPGINPFALNVTRIQPVDGPPPPSPVPGTSATFNFELTVKGEPPAGTRFFGVVPAEGCISVPLSDPDADGLYTGSLDVPRFPPGPVPPAGTDPVSLPVQIVQGTGTQGSDESSSPSPGEPTSVIEDFGPVQIEDQTISASVSFEEDRGGNTTPGSNNDDTSDEGGSDDGLLGGAATGISGFLPGMGGTAILALIGAGILLVGGQLIRRLFR